ncbi:unnamed protein product [Paramecium octaurelia]|uniref:Uncharacterized protein n=1 Tax=Paramecium octaurelia TaxID=43137 RepID=A0A8S1YAB7_PAROT|nr:unnamed protein product [Paramecium octaurelia]
MNLQLSLTQQLLNDYKKFLYCWIQCYNYQIIRLDVELQQNQLIKDINEFLIKGGFKTQIVFFLSLKKGQIQRSMLIYGENQKQIKKQLIATESYWEFNIAERYRIFLQQKNN